MLKRLWVCDILSQSVISTEWEMEYRWFIQERFLGDSWMACITMNCTEQQDFWGSYTSRNATSLDWRGHKWDEIKAGSWTSGILLVGPAELFSFKHVLSFKNREECASKMGQKLTVLTLLPWAQNTRPREKHCLLDWFQRGWGHCFPV